MIRGDEFGCRPASVVLGVPRVHVVTNIPSYHQVDLFDALSRRRDLALFVTYLRPITPGRQWKELPLPRHPHKFLDVWFNGGSAFVNPGIVGHLLEVEMDLTVVTQYSGLSYQVAMYMQALRRRPWVFWSERPGVRHFEVESGIPAWIKPLVRGAALSPVAFASRIWGVGNRAQAEYARICRRACENLPYYSDLGRFARREEPYCPNGRVRFLFAGRFSYRKGFDTLCAAFRRLARRDIAKDVELSVCGDGDLRELLRAVVDDGVKVRNLGFRELADMPDVMRAHDVLVLPSRYDGWGMVVPEALAAGLTVIATRQVGSAVDVGGTPRSLRFFDADDEEALEAQLTACVEDRAELPALGHEAESLARTYDVHVGAERFVALAREALDPARATCV